MLNVYEEARQSATDAREEQTQEITILNAMSYSSVYRKTGSEGRKERPTQRKMAFDDCDAFLIWTLTQVCFHNQCVNMQRGLEQCCALVMKTTLMAQLVHRQKHHKCRFMLPW